MKSTSILLLLISMLVSIQGSSFTMHISCTPCTISCAFANCYRMVTDGYDQQICSSVSCPSSYSVDITVDGCSMSSSGVACSSGLCVASAQMNYCMGGLTCSPSYSMSTTCGSCSSAVSSCNGNCLTVRNSNSPTPYEYCFGSSCNGVTRVDMTMSPCSSGVDFFGAACTCCVSASTSGVTISTCTDSNPLFASN